MLPYGRFVTCVGGSEDDEGADKNEGLGDGDAGRSALPRPPSSMKASMSFSTTTAEEADDEVDENTGEWCTQPSWGHATGASGQASRRWARTALRVMTSPQPKASPMRSPHMTRAERHASR